MVKGLFPLLSILLLGNIVEASPFAYIADASHGKVNVIDTATDSVTASVTVGAAPSGAVVNPSGTRVYVANHGDGTVSVIDTTPNTSTTNTVIKTITVGPGPLGIATNPAGTRVYVGNNVGGTNNTVSVIDTTPDAPTTNTVIATINVGFGPGELAVNPAGTRLYVINNRASTLSIIDTNNNSVIAIVGLSGSFGGSGIVVNQTGTRVYIGGSDARLIHVLDTGTNAIVAEISLPGRPGGIALTPDGTRLYAALNFNAGLVAVVDTANNSLLTTISVSGDASTVAITPDGARAYVTVNPNTVSVINTASNATLHSVAVPSARSFGSGSIGGRQASAGLRFIFGDCTFSGGNCGPGSTVPSSVQSAIAQVAQIYAATFTGLNATIDVEWAPIVNDLGRSHYPFNFFNYSTWLNDLRNAPGPRSSNDAAALASLPATNPFGAFTVAVNSANQRAMGLSNPFTYTGYDGTPLDGIVVFDSNASFFFRTGGTIGQNQYDFFWIAQHEIDEVLGTYSCLANCPSGVVSPGDLFRYQNAGNRSFTTNSSTPAWFSIDGGNTLLVRYDQTGSGDYGDWASSGSCPPDTPRVQDALLCPGHLANLGAESTLLDVVGYSLAVQHPAFFTGEAALSGGVYYLQFPGSGNLFGYYTYTFFPILYHFDLGFEYFQDANDGKQGAYLYDFTSGHWFYTSPSYGFPYLFDFTLNATLFYYPASGNPGHYSSNPRYFYNFSTGAIFTM